MTNIENPGGNLPMQGQGTPGPTNNPGKTLENLLGQLSEAFNKGTVKKKGPPTNIPGDAISSTSTGLNRTGIESILKLPPPSGGSGPPPAGATGIDNPWMQVGAMALLFSILLEASLANMDKLQQELSDAIHNLVQMVEVAKAKGEAIKGAAQQEAMKLIMQGVMGIVSGMVSLGFAGASMPKGTMSGIKEKLGIKTKEAKPEPTVGSDQNKVNQPGTPKEKSGWDKLDDSSRIQLMQMLHTGITGIINGLSQAGAAGFELNKAEWEALKTQLDGYSQVINNVYESAKSGSKEAQDELKNMWQSFVQQLQTNTQTFKFS